MVNPLAALAQRMGRAAAATVLETAIDCSANGVTIADALDPEMPLIYVNQGFERITGYSAAEVLGRNCRFLQGSETASEDLDELRRAIRAGEDCVVEFLNYRKDGTAFWNELRMSPVRDEVGTVTHFIGIQMDVTARRRAQERSQQLAQIVHHVQDAVIAHDLEGRVTVWNSGAEVIYGYETAEMLGHDIRCLVPPERVGEFARLMTTTSAGLATRGYETVRVRKDGRRVTVSITMSPIRDNEGHVVGAAKVVRDVTAAREAERSQRDRERLLREREQNLARLEKEFAARELTESRRRLDTVVTNLPIMLLALDPDGAIVLAEGRALDILPYPREKLVGHNVSELFHESPEARQAFARALGGEAFTSVATVGSRQFETHFRPRRNDQGVTETILAVSIDVTDRLALEAELRHAQKMESLGHMAAGIAHEVSTPSQYVLSNLQFLQKALPELVSGTAEGTRRSFLEAEVPSAIEQSLDGLRRIGEIVQAMKEFSHPGANGFEPADLNAAIRSTLVVSRNEWKHEAEVVTDLDPNLPSVPCQRSEINQVVLNLIVNAAHAIADARAAGLQREGRIRVSTRRSADAVEISVEDNGCGIPESAQPHVYDLFFTTKEPGRGTGQGLAIAHRIIVGRHRGQLYFETNEGEGTRFVIRLPIAPSLDAAA